MTKTKRVDLRAQRRQKALDRVLEALHSDHPTIQLSDVFFDAKACDLRDPLEDYGYDCDDLADLLHPVLESFFARQVVTGNV